MPDVPKTEIDAQLDKLADDFATGLDALSANPMLRDGIVKAAIVDLCWAIFNRMPDNRAALAEGLEQMDEIIRKAAVEERETAE